MIKKYKNLITTPVPPETGRELSLLSGLTKYYSITEIIFPGIMMTEAAGWFTETGLKIRKIELIYHKDCFGVEYC